MCCGSGAFWTVDNRKGKEEAVIGCHAAHAQFDTYLVFN